MFNRHPTKRRLHMFRIAGGGWNAAPTQLNFQIAHKYFTMTHIVGAVLPRRPRGYTQNDYITYADELARHGLNMWHCVKCSVCVMFNRHPTKRRLHMFRIAGGGWNAAPTQLNFQIAHKYFTMTHIVGAVLPRRPRGYTQNDYITYADELARHGLKIWHCVKCSVDFISDRRPTKRHFHKLRPRKCT